MGFAGFDGVKNVKGIKRHLIVDSNGFLINAKVLPANISDSLGAQILLYEIPSFLAFIKIILLIVAVIKKNSKITYLKPQILLY